MNAGVQAGFSHRWAITATGMRVLVVEDETALRDQLADLLRQAGYAVDAAADGLRAEYLGRTETYDAAVLDLGLPRLDGLTVVRRWRDAGVTTPVLVLTARDRWSDKVRGIDGGADDYLTKPFQAEELLARLRGLIRRASRQLAPELRVGDVVLDPAQARVTVRGDPVRLTALELRVFAYLMHHRDRVVPQAELVEHIYARDEDRDSNTVEVFVARLRRKLGAATIETVRGFGYRVGADT
jgi:two-component system OmpR family response regulator